MEESLQLVILSFTFEIKTVYSLHTTQTVKHGEGFIFGQNHPSSVEIKIGVDGHEKSGCEADEATDIH